MTLGSLFDGAGTFPFAGTIYGIIPLWASEIEAFPIEVTSKRFPQMKHLGDVTKIKGSEIAPVDVITFGSPCQDLSVAGKRAGLDGERSGLFMEAIRIIKEMREKTNGKYPRYAVWENVPGAFGSNKGEDFRKVIEEICKVKDSSAIIPRPTNGKWKTAGLILADGYSIGWRVLDAQFWGVPQRRRRIFLVADFGGGSAGEILFEQEGLQRSFAESRCSWNGIADNSTYGTYSAGGINGSGIGRTTVAPPPVIPLDNHPADSRVTIGKNAMQTLTSRMGTGGGNTPLLLVYGVDTYNKCLTGDKAKTLLAGHTDADGVPCVAINLLQDAVPNEDISPCLSTGNPKTGQANLAIVLPAQKVVGSLCASDAKLIQNQTVVQDKLLCFGIYGDKSGTLDANYFKGCGERNGTEREVIAQMLNAKWIVRRVTPTECARLQGMPDWWCKDIPHKDAPEYKMWGNGMALPCVLYVMQGLAIQMKKQLLQKLEVKR